MEEVVNKVLFRDLSEERRWEVIHDGLQFSDFWWEQVQEEESRGERADLTHERGLVAH